MSAEVSFTKRAAAELSRCFNGLTVSRGSSNKKSTSTANGSAGSSGVKVANPSSSGSSNNTAVNNKEKDSPDKCLKPSQVLAQQQQQSQQQSTESSALLSNMMWKEEKVLRYTPLAVPPHSSSSEVSHLLHHQPEFLARLESKQSLLYHGGPRGSLDEAIITKTSTTINPFKPSTPSKRPPPRAPPKTWRARRANYLLNLPKPNSLFELWRDAKFLLHFFTYFTSKERCLLAQVCIRWRDVLYSEPLFWKGLMPVIYYNDLRRITEDPLTSASDSRSNSPFTGVRLRQDSLESNSSKSDSSFDETFNFSSSATIRANIYSSIEQRGFDCICLFGATDNDVFDFASRISPSALRNMTFGSLRCSSVTDKGLDIFLASLSQSLKKLELSGCNEISDSGLWTSLIPHLESLIIQDSINIADETVAAITQMLPELKELTLQAYHVTDTSMAYFGPTSARESLRALHLQHCWELSNQGVLNIAHGIPHLERLSLSGCSKITDDAIEVIAEQLRALTYLDLSWCSRISEAALEYIACDLSDTLNELILDRCLHITDIGLGYIATMGQLASLSLRWCPQISDFGLQTLCSMKSLKVLSLAGCPQLSVNGLSCLVQMQQLTELELTNCPGATKELLKYLKENLPPSCTIIV